MIIGEVDGKPLRIETTLLPETKTVQWGDQRVEALQSQFCAYLTGRIAEVAVDLYAQADDGSVWYLGEDVVDYDNGVAVTTEGTWQVGLDGPAALIMPAHPKVGDVYRTENVPGVAFEQVTIRKVGVTVDGPSGPIRERSSAKNSTRTRPPLSQRPSPPGMASGSQGATTTSKPMPWPCLPMHSRHPHQPS